MERTFDIVVQNDHPVFAGHFPGRPIVPGVLLLDWMLAEIEQRECCKLLPGILSVAKFLNPVAPGAILSVHYRRAENNAVVARIECQRQAIATATFAVAGLPA